MRVIIAGNGVAGITTAKILRELKHDIEITVFAEERYHYYPRPMLIEFIANKVDEKALSFYPEDWYMKNRIRVHLNSPVRRINTAEKKVLVNDTWHDYDALVLATGARAFMPPFRGLPKRNVFTLRTLDDAKAIKAQLIGTKAVIIIGGGLLGLETARALKEAKSSLNVRVLEKADSLLSRQLDGEGSGILRALIEEMGIDVQTNVEVSEIFGTDAAEKAIMNNGAEIDAQLVIVSAGVRPNLDLAKDAGLEINRGLIVDTSLCCKNHDTIFAVGDVVEFEGATYGIIPAALDQAKIVARMIVGHDASEYRGTIPSNTLKILGIDLSSMGLVNPPENEGYEEIRAKSDDGRAYKKYVLKDGKIVGAIVLGRRKEIPRISKLIRDETNVEGLKSKMRQIDFDFAGL